MSGMTLKKIVLQIFIEKNPTFSFQASKSTDSSSFESDSAENKKNKKIRIKQELELKKKLVKHLEFMLKVTRKLNSFEIAENLVNEMRVVEISMKEQINNQIEFEKNQILWKWEHTINLWKKNEQNSALVAAKQLINEIEFFQLKSNLSAEIYFKTSKWLSLSGLYPSLPPSLFPFFISAFSLSSLPVF